MFSLESLHVGSDVQFMGPGRAVLLEPTSEAIAVLGCSVKTICSPRSCRPELFRDKHRDILEKMHHFVIGRLFFL